ncbi:unnamed protein product [Anisakis simplex]|uniref:Cytochrome P450 4V2 (inferred by orthology to a human protein) n=1 Tax=Anisakis simplex TaxID=6269 RepID=A0A0M3J2L3_ANISI|nr:unnamed protein product [Anisakis simplex]
MATKSFYQLSERLPWNFMSKDRKLRLSRKNSSLQTNRSTCDHVLMKDANYSPDTTLETRVESRPLRVEFVACEPLLHSMGLLGVAFIVALVTWVVSFLAKKLRGILDKISVLQGPAILPFTGNLHQLCFKPDEFFEQVQGVAYMLGKDGSRMARIWFSGWPCVLIYGADECESVLGSNRTLTKPFQYGFLSGWIGQGLLIRIPFSEPKKWRSRRKLLTPTFHYDILKDFVGVS